VEGRRARTDPRRILTGNRMGWSSETLSPLNQFFVDWCRSGACGPDSPALDIGAGYGAATLAALQWGAWVIANDLSNEHLDGLSARVPSELRPRLTLKPGRFPRHLHFEEGTLGAVHASNVFHFLTGRQMEEGMRAIARWLRPGGMLFVQASTPYQAPFAAFIPEFERRLAAEEKWPGLVAKVSEISSHRQRSQMPRSIHLLDDRVLRRAAEESGLTVQRAWLFLRADLPATLRLDGRECVGLAVSKAGPGR
jgi:SAM-dependent methyltransferase